MAKSFQIDLSDAEKQKLINRIENDFLLAKASHLRYSEACARWLQKWEARVDPQSAADKGKPNHAVPLVQWQVFQKQARDMQAMLGEEAAITAKATGPTDRDVVHKIGCYMTSRVFDQMKLVNPLCEFIFRRTLNGWSAAYRPWVKDEFTTLENGKEKRVCDYEGPGFFPLEPDDLVVPGERGVKSLQDFSYIIRRVPVTIDDLQRGDGTLYQGTSKPEFVEKLIGWANNGPTNDYTMVGQDPVRSERERSEGVDYDSYMMGRRSIWMWEWYGFWRPLRGRKDGAEDDLKAREMFEREWVVRYIPGMKQIVGVQDLVQLYPKMRRRRPFVESTLIKDGTYRGKGFGALLEDLEDEATGNSRLFTAAGELSVWPIVFYKPGGGMVPGNMRLEPGMAIPTEDPSSVNVVKLSPNLDYAIAKQQDTFATSERITGITDQSMGRSIDRPNAPKTATGQLALIEEGNVRAYLDGLILREDMEQIIEDIWYLDCDLAPRTEPGLFFRVTEQQANGLFNVKQGGAFMTAKEFGGKYDFKLKFATSVWSRQAKKQDFFAFYQAAVQNPLLMQNPTGLWQLLNLLAKNFDIDFAEIVPKPPELDRPKSPDEEWTEMLEGETVMVNPQDDDQLHLQQHISQLEDERKDPDRDVGAIGLMVKHILDHQMQVRTKMLMQTLTQNLMQSLQPPQQSPAQQTVQQLQQMYSAPPQPQLGMPQQGAPPGEIGPPPAGVGSQAAPQPQDGML